MPPSARQAPSWRSESVERQVCSATPGYRTVRSTFALLRWEYSEGTCIRYSSTVALSLPPVFDVRIRASPIMPDEFCAQIDHLSLPG